MDLNNFILSDVKDAIGLSTEPTLFDTEILMHVNTALVTLGQNGVGLPIMIDDLTTWADLQDLEQTEGNKVFQMVPLFIALNVKLLFDPPPPSSVAYHSSSIDQILWRLKLAYEEPFVKPTGDTYEPA